MVEYGLLVALIALVALTGVSLLGTNLLALFNTVAGSNLAQRSSRPTTRVPKGPYSPLVQNGVGGAALLVVLLS